MPDQPSAPETVVGIGASAGGVAALQALFAGLPATSGIAYVVVIHLREDHDSRLAEILQRSSRLPVVQVTEPVRIAADCVYVIPPGWDIEAVDGALRLVEVTEGSRRAPIDHFFRSLGQATEGQSVAVVLSGTGSDGSLGLDAVKAAGGLAIVQDPADAEFDGMPSSAIATGLADRVLTLEQIPSAIVAHHQTRPRVDVTTRPDGGGSALVAKALTHVRTQLGHDLQGFKPATVLRRIRRRMHLQHIEEAEDYLEVLRRSRPEVEALLDDLLIGVTSFFRDPDVFEHLDQHLLPEILEGKDVDDSLRIWSVGCATGEEAYSLAMLVHEHVARSRRSPTVQIFATDLSARSLRRARDGVYPRTIEDAVSAERLRRYFVAEQEAYRVSKLLREMVVFAPHDLLRDPPFSRLDLVVCRNLLIYLKSDVQRDVIELFHYALDPGGHLLLGTSETVDRLGRFDLVDKRACLYRRRDVPTGEPRLPVFGLRVPPPEPVEPGGDAGQADRTYGSIHASVVERYAPPSLLVGDDHAVVHYSASVGRYLVHPGGVPTTDVVRLVRPELRRELRSCLYLARDRQRPTRSKPVRTRLDGDEVSIMVRVHPTGSDDGAAGLYLVIFDEVEPVLAPAETGATTADVTVQELEAELDVTRQRLQAVIEEFERSQEEMRASNEEMQSANEELRSTMEELETSREELQSMNEELITLNQENRHKVEELRQLSDDLQNLLASTDIATLFLDRELRIMRFTPRVGEVFNVRLSDRGRPVADLTHRLRYDELLGDAEQVLARLAPVEREVERDDGRWYLARLVPYRTTDDRIDGVVLTLVDITGRRDAEFELLRLNEQLEQRVRAQTAEVRTLASNLSMAEHDVRRRISQLLHDDLQQRLHAVHMRVGLAHEAVDAGDTAAALAALDAVSAALAEAVAVLRSLSIDLSPPILATEGLEQALGWLAAQMAEMHGLRVDISSSDVPDLPGDIRVFLFHMVRELLFNVVKHAGTDRAAVRLARVDDELIITVSDDGRGFDPAAASAVGPTPGHLGLAGVRERLALLGGDLHIETAAGRGSKFRMILPLGGEQS